MGVMNKLITVLTLFAASVATIGTLSAETVDDRRWVNQCIRDNKGLASPAVVLKYCVCMNDKMDDNETRSISQWERANPKARAECSRAAGWN
jgi:hypothetical protein